MEFNFDPTIRAATEIFVPRVQYPKGFRLDLSSGLAWKYDDKLSIVYIRNVAVKSDQVVFVNIRPSVNQ